MHAILADLTWLPPVPSEATYAFIRAAYGILQLGTLLLALPQAHRFFLSERWGGYGQSRPLVEAVQNPAGMPVALALWIGSAVLLVMNRWTVTAAFMNLLLCRYFFVQMRWHGVLRGMGAPGFMSYWLGAMVFFLEYTHRYAPELRSLAVLVFQVDFAFIMLSAGIYKLTAGYARNEGMELGLANPQWGHWWRAYQRLRPRHWLFAVLNQLAWATEVVAGVLMLIPATRFIGAVLIIISFAFIATHIRLGFLCEMVMLCGVLFFHPGSLGASLLDTFVPAMTATLFRPAPGWVNVAVAVFLWSYLALLPLAHGGLFYNFYARRALARPVQRALEAYTNFFGIIIWRVFSVDHTNFCILIHQQPLDGGPRRLVSQYGSLSSLRYSHVAECIAVTSVFTTLKYYPSNDSLFRDRLLRYARTVPCPDASLLVFGYCNLVKQAARFAVVPVAEYLVNPRTGTIEERTLDERVSVRAAHAVSPVHEAARPGTYAPSVS